jgi:hypothetical protein
MEECWKLNWDINETDFWLFKPVEHTKFMLVSWRMCGSEFIRESIRENFPSTENIRTWGKTHVIPPRKYQKIIKNTRPKIIFCIADPRDVAAHIKTFGNGGHIHHRDSFTDINNETIFLNENLKKITNLMTYYSKTFSRDMIILRYEDAVKNRRKFLNQVSKFLGEKPLNVDDREKYLSPMYKQIGVYRNVFSEKGLSYHKRANNSFYNKWGY